ncbi:hypothetical protein CNEO4_580050 [Clostridium neonatale]|uniref:Uncharacterized protein n=1 Tax=Clostridium neonatale TaxID=137838 RepID=A0AA86JG91_9CLOT|nr:hypothetical protein CNEO_41446 [Clostridium neonatale]CAG9714471.1 hypothetical protein CNEO_90109 [Clostridium neonatale]CAG9717508.1 hypothetical protein CNEO_490050 [Clostridium neonatale]CAI3535296.1 hypothetical protein CNEO4_1060005 [Clostridium neonatale]CAI3560994.1 hypothetical protein CNEO3_100074 [Clostridium neonatale]
MFFVKNKKHIVFNMFLDKKSIVNQNNYLVLICYTYIFL